MRNLKEQFGSPDSENLELKEQIVQKERTSLDRHGERGNATVNAVRATILAITLAAVGIQEARYHKIQNWYHDQVVASEKAKSEANEIRQTKGVVSEKLYHEKDDGIDYPFTTWYPSADRAIKKALTSRPEFWTIKLKVPDIKTDKDIEIEVKVSKELFESISDGDEVDVTYTGYHNVPHGWSNTWFTVLEVNGTPIIPK